MDMNQSNQENADDESNDSTDQCSQDKFPQSQRASKRSRPNSKAASTVQQLRSQSNPQISKSWNSTNPFINFMTDFRKMQTGQKSTNIFRLGGEQWRNMTEDEKQPFVDAANENKKLKPSQLERKQKQKQSSSLDQQQSKTRANKDNVPGKSSSQKVPSLKKREGTEQRHEAQPKRKCTKSDTDTDTDTDTSGSIHTATTDCASADSGESH